MVPVLHNYCAVSFCLCHSTDGERCLTLETFGLYCQALAQSYAHCLRHPCGSLKSCAMIVIRYVNGTGGMENVISMN